MSTVVESLARCDNETAGGKKNMLDHYSDSRNDRYSGLI